MSAAYSFKVLIPVLSLALMVSATAGCRERKAPAKEQHSAGDGHDHAKDKHSAGDGHDHAKDKHSAGDGHDHSKDHHPGDGHDHGSAAPTK